MKFFMLDDDKAEALIEMLPDLEAFGWLRQAEVHQLQIQYQSDRGFLLALLGKVHEALGPIDLCDGKAGTLQCIPGEPRTIMSFTTPTFPVKVTYPDARLEIAAQWGKAVYKIGENVG